MNTSEQEFDLIIAGSGGGGMMTALTAHHHGLRPLIIEKSQYWGGTTARSGGVIWIPDNPVMRKAGVKDSVEEGRRYLEATVKGRTSQARQDAFLEQGIRMVDFLEKHTCVELQFMPGFSDYYPEAPGGRAIGRCVEPVPYNGKQLGKLFEQLQPPTWELLDNFRMTGNEFHKVSMWKRTWPGKWAVMKVGLRMLGDWITRRKHLTMGRALMSMLGKSVQEAGIPIWLDTRVQDLVEENGKVVGVVAVQNGKEMVLKARKGVVFATGGIGHNDEMRKRYHPQPSSSAWSMASKGNTGDGILIAEKHGAALDLMEESWWGPMSKLPNGNYFFHLAERAHPGTIIVDRGGKRFLNEAKPYNEFVQIVHRKHAEGVDNVPCYYITDDRARRRYAFGVMRPGRVPSEFLKGGLVMQADSLAELARIAEIDAESLEETVRNYNEMARKGKDEDFGKGDSAFDRRFGDPTVEPNPCMAPLDKPPYYCMRMYPGDIGTKGGILTDERARVLRADGSVIEGFYATGNTSAAVMGHTYPAAGATIGSAMTFGYVAALDLAGKHDAGVTSDGTE